MSYGEKAWTLTKEEEQAVLIFERKIYDPKYENGEWKGRKNREIEEMSKGENIVKWIKGQRISWLGQLERMEEDRMPKKIFTQELVGDEKKGTTQGKVERGSRKRSTSAGSVEEEEKKKKKKKKKNFALLNSLSKFNYHMSVHRQYIRRVQPTKYNVSQFIYFCKTLYMFQTVFPSIIRGSKLHIQRPVFVRPLLLPAAGRDATVFELLMIEGKPV